RISSVRSTVHSNIYFPDYVVVVDETLIASVDVTKGLKPEGAIVINSTKTPAEIRSQLKGYPGKVCTIDAGKISEEELGRNFPNTPMLAAIVKITGVVDVTDFISDMEASFKHKFASKPQVIEGNMRALKRSMEEVLVG
ncbi:MAG: 2-oxoacid:acceptor oxidoreductase family protein, partial [Oscillibacter sp.]